MQPVSSVIVPVKTYGKRDIRVERVSLYGSNSRLTCLCFEALSPGGHSRPKGSDARGRRTDHVALVYGIGVMMC